MSIALPSPQLSWLPHGTPYSERFGDVYRSKDGALAESRAVFLQGCGLPKAWAEAHTFTIGETGFGTGLNFLVALEAWRRTKRSPARLHYIAVEGFPISHQDLRECVSRWPELRSVGQALLRAYLHPQPGFQRLFLDNGRVVLTLLFGEALPMLSALDAHIDAWFLDGFAPDKNPEMWRPEVLAEIARLSKPGARLATYTAAGQVRRQLSAIGFDVVKAPGFGAKNEMIRATFNPLGRGSDHGSGLIKDQTPPWFAAPPVSTAHHGHAVIVGAGLAGANTAYALHKRGWRTTIIDRRATIADEASGNPVGVLMPRLTAAENLDGRFYARAWRMCLDQLEDLADAGVNIARDRCGVLQLAVDNDDERLKAIADLGALPEPLLFYVGAAEASEIAGCALPYSALYFPQGGWVNPKLLCAALARHSAFIGNTTVGAIQHTHGLWDVHDQHGRHITSADAVVFANAMSAGQMPQLSWLPLSGRRGQISFLTATTASSKLHCVLGYGGYITPAHRGQHCVGATFDWTDDVLADQPVVPEDHTRNTDDLARTLPWLAQQLSTDAVDPTTVTGRAAIRCTTPDHLPVAGAVPDQTAYLQAFAELRHGHPWARYASATYQPGLYVLAGLGARGLVAAPLAAEVLACQITGEPPPVERDVALALHPGRFLIRDLKRLKV